MPSVTGATTFNVVEWGSTDNSVHHFDIYRRADSVTASITTADVVARVGLGNNRYNDPTDNGKYWYWVKAVSWAGNESAFSDTITATGTQAVDTYPLGFPNRTDSVLSFTDGTRTFSISPSATAFDYYIKGAKYTITAAQTVVVDNSSGLTIIAFDSAGITSQKDPTDTQVDTYIRNKALCGMVYWSTAANTNTYFGDERHGIVMDPHTHTYLHFTQGCKYMTGLALNTITADQTGATDDHAQFGVDTGTVADEDLDTLTAAIASTTGLEVYYRDTDTYWRKSTNAGFSILVSGTPLMYYNNPTGWGLTEVTSGRFALCHVFASSEVDNPVFAIMGQAEYTTALSAREGATTEMNSILLGDLPTAELVPIASVIFQTSNAYGNSVQSRIRTTDEGDDYVDWRTTQLSRGAAASHHGSLSGLFDDDHPQYLLLTGRGGQVIDDTLTICGVTTFSDTAVMTGIELNGDIAISGDITTVGFIQFDTTWADGHSEGRMHWDDDTGGLEIDMKGGTVKMQVGQEQMFRAYNDSGVDIANGDAVYVSGGTGAFPTIAKADASDLTKIGVAGLATEAILNNNFGYVTSRGLVRDLNTSGLVAGARLYLSATTPGKYSSTRTAAPNYVVAVGQVIRVHATEGVVGAATVILPKTWALSDVAFSPATTHGQFLRWDTSTAVYTPMNLNLFETAAGTITIGSHLVPTAGETIELGSITNSFKSLDVKHLRVTANASVGGLLFCCASVTVGGDLYVTGNITLGAGVLLDCTAAGTMTVGGHIIPSADNTYGLGDFTTGNRWKWVDTVQGMYRDATTRITWTASGSILFGGTFSPSANNTFSIGTSALKVGGVHAVTASFTNLEVSGSSVLTGGVNIGGRLEVNDTMIVSGGCTFRSNLQVDGDFILNGGDLYHTGNITMDGNLKVGGTSNFSGAVTIDSSYLDMQEIAVPANPAATHGRMYVAETGGTTTLFFRDSAGTETNLLAGGGNAVYLEAGAVAQWNTSGADGYLNFDSDFSLTTNGQSSTVSLASGLTLDGGLTINGGLTVSGATSLGGNTTVSGNLTVNGTAQCTNLDVTGSAHITGALRIDSSLDVGGALIGRSIGTYSGALTINNEIKVTSHCTVDGIGYFNTGINISGDTTLSNGSLLAYVDVAVDGSYDMSLGNLATPTATRKFNVEHQFTSPTTNEAAIYASCRHLPATTATSTTFHIGVDGFSIMDNTNCTGNYVGLRFGPYAISTVGGHTAHSTTYGVYTWAARGYACEFKAANCYGIYISPWINDFGAEIYCTNNYGLYIDDADAINGSGTITNQYGAFIAEPTRGTNNYQTVLAGNGTAGHGLWIGGTGGIHIGWTGSFIYMADLRNQSGTYNMRYNTTTKEVSYTSSSRKDKENIRAFSDDWHKILDVKPKKFNFPRDPQDSIGYIAEDFDELGLKDLVTYANGEPKNIEYDKITLYLVEIVKEQQKRIDKLEKKINGLDSN